MDLNLQLDRPLVVFDIESTGVNARGDRIIELAAVRLAPDGCETSKCWLLNPGVPIPPETTVIHGITDEIVKDCPTFAEAADEILDFFKDADLGGFNSDRFDIPCLEEEFVRAGRSFQAAQRRHIDVQRIYHRMEPRDLSAAVRFYLGREHDGAHGAEADALATLDVLKAQLTKYDELPKRVAELDEYLMPHDPLNLDRQGMIRWTNGAWCVNFGKKKGTPLKEIFMKEKGFLRWVVNGSFDVEVRQVCSDLLERGIMPPAPSLPKVQM